jgi:3-hydroxybutyryl-CoA dehydrogenase
MKNIVVIGSGTMGNGIAHVFAQFGHRVHMVDIQQPALDKAMATIGKNLDRQVSKGTLDENQKQQTLNNITPTTSLESAVEDADLVVEAATENVSVKLDLFKKLDDHPG